MPRVCTSNCFREIYNVAHPLPWYHLGCFHHPAQPLCVPYFPALKPPIFTPFPHSDISNTFRMPNPLTHSLTHVVISWLLSNFGSFEEGLPKTSLSKLLCRYQFSIPGDLQLCSIRVPSSAGAGNCPTLSWSGYNVLNSPQLWVRVPVVQDLPS